MTKPRLLDLFCGAGGAGMGYHQAGFEVVGVDINQQKNYPFEFIQADAMTYPLDGFDAIHASPPCQAYSAGKNMWKGRLADDRHPDLVSATRERLIATGLPYVIENVVGSPLVNYITLCGDMFGLGVKRHRLFESNVEMQPPAKCRRGHPDFVASVFGGGGLSRTPPGGSTTHGAGNFMQRRVHVPHEDCKKAMGIDWMIRDELSQSIPPAYTKYVGKYLMAEVQALAVAA
ncbi:MAG: DNA cytosine methyltransferase [Phycisphaerae bacterium]|jgi:DNA (cytosine-5)-methyltransferase 1